MSSKILNSIFLIIAASALAIAIWAKMDKPSKVGFVRSQYVLENYYGFKEADGIYQQKINEWEIQLTTVKSTYESKIKTYNENENSFSKDEKLKYQQEINQIIIQIQKMNESIQVKAKEEESEMLQGVLNQVNAYIEKYGKENKFDLVLGVTLSGNILYGSDATDISEEILEGLNEENQGL